VLLDVDGTLSPIAPTPAEASIPAATRDVVRSLARARGVSVALVTGRAAVDAHRMAQMDDVWIIGNHGYELRAPDGSVSAPDEAERYRDAVVQAGRDLTDLAEPGAFVENKGWTLSFHYRLVDPARASAVVDRALAVGERLGLSAVKGRKVLDLRPPLTVTKGTSARDFASRLGALEESGSLIYAGDDRTDEDAFQELRSAAPRAVTVRVVPSDEDPRETLAELEVPSTDAMRELLQWLAARRAADR
jgi:trehalose-phosphatase